MNERKFKIFYNVATKLNMTKVAEEMYISQPSISQAIKEIEEELGCLLFERLGRRLYLTHEGEVFLSYTRRILNLMNESRERIKAFNDLEHGSLSIGTSTTIGVYMLPSIIRKFKEDYPKIDVSISIKNTEEIIHLLLNNELDFALVEGMIHNDELIVSSFYKDELVFIAPKEHIWSQKEFLEAEDIEKERFIMREHGSGTREIVEEKFKKNKIKCNPVFEIGHSEAIKGMVLNGLGVSCISKLCLETNKDQFTIKTFKNAKLTRDFYLIYHKDKFLNKLIKTFFTYIGK